MFKYIFILITGVLFDYGSKLLVINNLAYHQWCNLFDSKFLGLNLFLTYNNGIAFGLFHNATNYQNILFLSLNFLAIITIIYVISRKNLDCMSKLAMTFIVTGATGNLLDRIIYGHVIDFIDFYIVWHKNFLHWYTFNLADSIICVGTGIFIYRSLIHSPKISL